MQQPPPVAIKKEITHKRLNISTTIQVVAAPSTYDPTDRFQCTQLTMEKQENVHKRENDGKKYSTYTISYALTKKKKLTTENFMAANQQQI